MFLNFWPQNSKNFGRSRKALFITMDLNFLLQNSNLIFQSKLLTNFLRKILQVQAYKNVSSQAIWGTWILDRSRIGLLIKLAGLFFNGPVGEIKHGRSNFFFDRSICLTSRSFGPVARPVQLLAGRREIKIVLFHSKSSI